MNQYHHFTIEEREMLLELLAKDYSLRLIAKELKRSPSTISREIKRNVSKGYYSPSAAQKNYIIKKKKCGRKKIISDPKIKDIIQKLFLEQQWSPEQISNRLKLEEVEMSISYNTIYRAIYAGMLEVKKLSHGESGVIRKLRHKGKSRHTKDYEERRGKIRITNNIEDRPEVINKRERIGDWEADTVMGQTGKACLVTLTDRKSRFLLSKKIQKKNSVQVKDAMIELLKDEPHLSITPDRGKEFSKHSEVTTALDNVPFYWPLPSHPWQRGTNENTNGLLREYFPKTEDMTNITDAVIEEKIEILNKRPRKCLSWKSPYEVYYNKVLRLI